MRFFIHVMLNMRWDYKRAEIAADNLCEKLHDRYDVSDEPSMWQIISDMNPDLLKSLCRFDDESETGYSGSYSGINTKFVENLQKNAGIILERYDGSTPNIWNGTRPENLDDLIEKFSEIHGIGEDLSRWATYTLVRSYGVAGGIEAKKLLKIKRDVHVRRVVGRAFGIEDGGVNAFIDGLQVDSPADFDFALWSIGKDLCGENAPACGSCPISSACAFHTQR